ncbi:ABC transporter permease [bacterium]|nr:ABC transporter permease [bacterium]
MAEGRNFTRDEVQQGKHMVIIGEEVKNMKDDYDRMK